MSYNALTVKDIAYLGISLAILEASKLALDFLPNVEVVTLLFIVYTIFFGRKTQLIAFGFTAIECLLKDVNVWSLMYLYIWPLLILMVFYAREFAKGGMKWKISRSFIYTVIPIHMAIIPWHHVTKMPDYLRIFVGQRCYRSV
jgi:energy-coupling factor transport system substrate-specific component